MQRMTRLMTWVPALGALLFGAWLRDCVLLAAAGLFALGGFLHRMDLDSPQRALGAGLRCIVAGLGAALTAATLALMLVGAWLQWWQPANDVPGTAATLLLVLFLLFRARLGTRGPRAGDQGIDAEPVLLTVALATLAGEWLGVPLLCCAFAAAAALFLAWAGWRLMHNDARLLWWAAR